MRTIILNTIIIAICLMLTSSAGAKERHIHVNGEHLSLELIDSLDHLTDKHVDDGFYWINFQTGAWGYEGNDQTLGYLDLSRLNNPKTTQKETAQSPPGAPANILVGAWMARRNASNGIYIESTTKWVFSADGTVAWGSGTVIAGGSGSVSLRGGGSNPPDFGRWSTEGEVLRINWNDGSAGQWTYSVFDYDGRPALALTPANGKTYYYKKID